MQARRVVPRERGASPLAFHATLRVRLPLPRMGPASGQSDRGSQ
jgi:hypothetical protein